MGVSHRAQKIKGSAYRNLLLAQFSKTSRTFEGAFLWRMARCSNVEADGTFAAALMSPHEWVMALLGKFVMASLH
jgi:hypothetical protein